MGSDLLRSDMSSGETPRRARDPDSGAQQTSLAQILCALPVALYLFTWALAGHQLLWAGALIALANLVILGIMVLVLAADRAPADDDS